MLARRLPPAFCLAGRTDYTCARQNIAQGYLTVSKSASAPATGKIAVGVTGVPLMAFDFIVAGEPVNVTQTLLRYTTVTAQRNEVTNVTLYKADGTILAGPKNGDTTHATPGNEDLIFTDAYTLPIGTTVVYVKADMASTMAALDTVQVFMLPTSITGKGANSGKATYTTSAGAVVPPAALITGNVETIQGPNLAITTAATPVVSNMVVNAQDQPFAYIDLNASGGGEDIRVSAITVTDTCIQDGGGLTVCADYTGLNNLELWGDPDNTDATAQNIRLATSNSTAVNDLTTTFQFQTPVVVSKTATSRLTLIADVVNGDTNLDAIPDSHKFNVAVVGNVVATGKTTGNTLAIGDKSVSGAGQAQTIQASGTLKVQPAADMPSAAQLVSSSMGNEVMKYKFAAQFEPIDVTTINLFCANNTANLAPPGVGTPCTLGNVAKVYVYADGVLVGNTSGYSFDANGKASVVLDSGTLVIPKDSYSTITLKIDLPDKTQVATSGGADLQIGIESAGAGGTTQVTDTKWGLAANVNNDYWIIATGQSSGALINKNTINSLGTVAASQVFGSNGFSAHKGILTVSLNASSPSGTQTPGLAKEVLRLNLTATGDDVTMRALELVNSGTATITGVGDLTVKSDDLGITYATVVTADANVYGGSLVPLAVTKLVIGPNGCTVAAANGNIARCSDGWTAANALQISGGTTKVIRIFGDTTGAASTKVYQMSVAPSAAQNVTKYGVVYMDSSGVNVGLAAGTYPATKNLPLNGGSLTY